MVELPEDLRIIIVRRGREMRCMIPMEGIEIQRTTPYALAALAISYFIALQSDREGHVDHPIAIVPGLEMALALPDAPGPLDPTVSLGQQLVGRWTDQDVPLIEEHAQGVDTPMRQCPVVALNLVDLNRN